MKHTSEFESNIKFSTLNGGYFSNITIIKIELYNRIIKKSIKLRYHYEIQLSTTALTFSGGCSLFDTKGELTDNQSVIYKIEGTRLMDGDKNPYKLTSSELIKNIERSFYEDIEIKNMMPTKMTEREINRTYFLVSLIKQDLIKNIKGKNLINIAKSEFIKKYGI